MSSLDNFTPTGFSIPVGAVGRPLGFYQPEDVQPGRSRFFVGPFQSHRWNITTNTVETALGFELGKDSVEVYDNGRIEIECEHVIDENGCGADYETAATNLVDWFAEHWGQHYGLRHTDGHAEALESTRFLIALNLKGGLSALNEMSRFYVEEVAA